jgi:acetyl esterase/lipase
MNRTIIGLCALLFVGCGATAASPLVTSQPTVPAVSPSAPAASRPPMAKGGLQTVTYCSGGGTPLAMDISLPTPVPSAPAPAVLYVHGGGWEHGSRAGGGFLDQLRPQLNALGFVVASIDYRLAPANAWPAQIIDAKCAVRYLRANASRYAIDAARIGAWGSSAGGHLVSLMGTADESAGFDVGEWSSESSRLAAVVDLFGPADLTAGTWNADPTNVITEVFGGAPGTITDTLTKASPVTWITRDDPSFLILQGDNDQTVPAAQSQEFAAKLQAAGVPATLVIVKGGPHGLSDPKEQPSPDQLVSQIADFFVRTLGPKG